MMRIWAALAMAFLTSAPAWGQGATAQMNGTVRDPAGLAVPDAEVRITQTATGAVRTTQTDASGSYVFTSLPIGPYQFTARKEGFNTYVQSGIVLQVNSDPTVDAVLKVGSVSEQIVVQADAALIETRSTGIGTVVDNQRVLEMPLNGRQATELIFLSGMANPAAGTGSLNSVRNYPTVLISVAGGQGNSITYNLDGVNHNDAYNNLNLPLPFPDALQEFKVETSALPAQYGYHSSAAVNAITKSGGNQFHGDLFWFLRNGDLNARNTFAARRDTLKRNQFGGVLGGPLKKDKLFFFLGYQGTTQRSEPTEAFAYVPTPDVLRGDFRTFASAECNAGRAFNLAASQGFVNNQISPARFSPAAVNLQKLLPTPTDPCGRVNYGLRSNSNEHLSIVRMDYQMSEKHSLFGRSYVALRDEPSTFDGVNALTMSVAASHYRVASLTLGDTYLLGPSIVNTFRVGANRVDAPKIPDNLATWKGLGINAINIAANNPQFAVTGGNGFTIGGGSAIFGLANTGPNYNIADDVGWIRGSHQITFGGSYISTLLNSKSGVNAAGNMAFNGTTTGLGIADLMLGAASGWRQGGVAEYYMRQKFMAAFAQDTWRVNSRMTINYGVRLEPYLPFTEKYGALRHFDLSRFSRNLGSSVYVNAPAGSLFPGDADWEPGGTRIAKNRWLSQLFPRVGLVFDPTGSGKMTIRASFGSFTDRVNLLAATPFAQNAPFGNNIILANVTMTDPWGTYPGGNPHPIPLRRETQFPTFGAALSHPFNWKPTQLNQWNVSVQRQVGDGWLLTVNYLGNNTSHLVTADNLNPAVFLGLGACTINGVNYGTCSTLNNTNQRRRLNLQNQSQGQLYGSISTLDDGGTANYNALFLSAQRRLSRGISLLANYTWSHCIGDLWNAFPGQGVSSIVPQDRRAMRGNCTTSDQRQVFNLSSVMQTPKFSTKALRWIASDWQFSSIVGLRSAQLFTVTSGIDVALTGENNQRPNQVNANPYSANQSAASWINRTAFASAAAGTYGQLGINNLKGPGVVKFDIGLSRTFAVREGKSFQVRGEAFNWLNWVNLNPPASALNNGTFGVIQSAGDPRIMQIATKFVF